MDEVQKNNISTNQLLRIAFFVSKKMKLVEIPQAPIFVNLKKKYDLIHCHAYPISLNHYEIPLILSASSCGYFHLHTYLGMTEKQINNYFDRDRVILKKLRVQDSAINLMDKTSHLIVWSDYAKKDFIKLGVDKKFISVVPPGLPF
jgi:glycosyltransferase involved in cell wall biosynthesis